MVVRVCYRGVQIWVWVWSWVMVWVRLWVQVWVWLSEVFVCLDINVGPDVLWMQVINKLRLKVVDGYRYKYECECWV